MKYICIHYTINAVSFNYLWYGAIYDIILTNTITLRKIYEYASELRKFSHFHILKLLFPSIFCDTSDTLSQKHIHFQVSNNICIHIYIMHFPFISYGMLYIHDSIRQNTNI